MQHAKAVIMQHAKVVIMLQTEGRGSHSSTNIRSCLFFFFLFRRLPAFSVRESMYCSYLQVSFYISIASSCFNYNGFSERKKFFVCCCCFVCLLLLLGAGRYFAQNSSHRHLILIHEDRHFSMYKEKRKKRKKSEN